MRDHDPALARAAARAARIARNALGPASAVQGTFLM
jgi:hypothetical protein